MDKKLLENIIINEEKLAKYLLVTKEKNDKSKFLSQAGYITSNWEILEIDLHSLLINGTIVLEEENEYGQSTAWVVCLKGQIVKN